MLDEGQGDLEGFLDRPANFVPYFLGDVGELEVAGIETNA